VTKRRAYGDGGLYWNERRQRWIATITVGYDGRGKRMVKTGSGRTKTEAKQKLREQLRDHEDGLALGRDDYTVGHAVEDWLAYGLGRQGPATLTKYRIFCGKHIIPLLGARKLRDLTAREVDAWLFELSKSLSTATLQRVRSCLNRAVKRAMARDLVKRNVVELTEVPTGRAGRRSKSLTPKQVDDVLTKTATDRLHTYIVVSLLTGGRTEELRALSWEHVHLEAGGSLPPHVEVWRSVRVGGDTKTKRYRRTLALPERCIEALCRQRAQQAADRLSAGERWRENPSEWTPRELRHSFVSLLSDAGVPLEQISQLVGHSGTTVTELVYRHQLRPVIQTGAIVMDQLFSGNRRQAD
jgi:integrase